VVVTGGDVRISVVVPTRDRARRVVRLLDALAAQDIGEPFEVVVVDDGSTDETLSSLRAYAAERPFSLSVVTSEQSSGPAGARNRGWRSARGSLIAFTDDDCVPAPHWLSSLVAELEQSDIAVGRTRPPDEQLHLIGPFSSYLDIGHDLSFSTCNIAYARPVLEATDGFDEGAFAFPNGEDTDLGLRATDAGYRDRFAPEALVWHDVGPSEFATHFRRIRRLDGIVALVARHPAARRNIDAGWFLRSVDKAVLIAWAAVLGLLIGPRRSETRLFAVVAALMYVWQFNRSHYRARSLEEWAASVPLGFVADSWAVMVMIRSSLRHRTLLL
jgi:glycosyltransferase involved in cell wall biosynthesis